MLAIKDINTRKKSGDDELSYLRVSLYREVYRVTGSARAVTECEIVPGHGVKVMGRLISTRAHGR